MPNLVAICSAHHHLVHDQGWRLVLSRGGKLRVFSPEGSELRAVMPGTPGSREGLAHANQAHDVGLVPEVPPAGGERLDLAYVIDAMLGLAGKLG